MAHSSLRLVSEYALAINIYEPQKKFLRIGSLRLATPAARAGGTIVQDVRCIAVFIANDTSSPVVLLRTTQVGLRGVIVVIPFVALFHGANGRLGST